MADFGAELARWMLVRGVGVRELHRRSGYSAGYITQLRQGQRFPSQAAAQDLDDALAANGELAARARLRPAGGERADRLDGRAPGCASSPVIAAIGEALHTFTEQGAVLRRVEVERDVRRAWDLRQSAEYELLGGVLACLLRDALEIGESVHVFNMVSSLLKRLGAFEMAAVAADRAFRAASQAGSPLLVGAAQLRVANVYLAASRHAEAVAVAAGAADDLAARSVAQRERAVFGALLLTAAVAAAKTGEAAQAWEFLGQAKGVAGEREHVSSYALFGPANLAVHCVQVATELGDGREALRRAERVDPARMPAALLERRTTLLIDIARAQRMQRDSSGAGETLIEAERTAPQEVRYSGAARSLLDDLVTSAKRPSADLRALAARVGVAA